MFNMILIDISVLQLVDTTVELANKVGPSEIINRIVDDLKDENEQYRKMVMETIEKVSFSHNMIIIYYYLLVLYSDCTIVNKP